MANGIPTPWDLYAVAPYQYPLVDQQPVVRIPVVGPEPFNTLVVVRGTFGTTSYRYADGKLQRRKIAVPTNFSLIGFDPRVPPPSQHSTSATLQMMQSTNDSAFVCAVDAIDEGFFDDAGRWTLVVHVADLWDNVIATSQAYLSSWVLCYEPPPNPDLPHGDRRFRSFKSATRTQLLEMGVRDPAPAGASLDTHVRKSSRRRQKLLESCCAPEESVRPSAAALATAKTFAPDDSSDVPVAYPPKTPPTKA